MVVWEEREGQKRQEEQIATGMQKILGDGDVYCLECGDGFIVIYIFQSMSHCVV